MVMKHVTEKNQQEVIVGLGGKWYFLGGSYTKKTLKRNISSFQQQGCLIHCDTVFASIETNFNTALV